MIERDQQIEDRKVSVIEECMEIFIFRDDLKNVRDHKACSKYRHYRFSHKNLKLMVVPLTWGEASPGTSCSILPYHGEFYPYLTPCLPLTRYS